MREKRFSADWAESGGVPAMILEGLGGRANVTEVGCCATRLRVTVADPDLVSEPLLERTGAAGVIRRGRRVQVIYGPQVVVIKSDLVDWMESGQCPGRPGPSAGVPVRPDVTLFAPMSGTVVPMREVPDPVFSTGVLGEGIAIEPSEGRLCAPADGEVEHLFETSHAVSLVTGDGMEILLHIGINTVELEGRYFQAHVPEGRKVKKGDLLLSFDLEAVKAAGYLCTTPMILCNMEDERIVTPAAEGRIQMGAPLLEIKDSLPG